MHRDDDFRTWNVFRRRHEKGLCCAVSAEMPVPTFLFSGEWDFGYAVADGYPPVVGFSPSAAEHGARFAGFYLFLTFSFPQGAAPDAGCH